MTGKLTAEPPLVFISYTAAGQGMRVLIVEDEASICCGLAGLLSLAVISGIFALYRTVAIQVRFAGRRNNFVSAVTHELKMPLTAIGTCGEMLRDGMVRDFGPGIAETHLKAVFEPFLRGEDELTRRQKGTGIGLSLVRDLVTLMRGRVRGINRDPGFEVRIALSSG
ncbi:MAG: ATP-binding protein [Myxococcales bacterium]|nr:ATP-binding protein [Myxococcales bacterium]